MVEMNVGYNGSENFAPGKRFGLFPAVSAVSYTHLDVYKRQLWKRPDIRDKSVFVD